ncbi:MAG TPA: alpha/beta hydrolase [Nitrosospira sp.]|jgi:pimeloyl-ACP methyl ester carboxylesterase|nr:alpha/beta hydrolase [Nitrosospira sp.]
MNNRRNAVRSAFGPRNLCITLLLTLLLSTSVFSQKKTHESLTATVNGVKIHYLKAGTGANALVLVHGFGETSHMWIPMLEEFGKDFTVIAPDMRGLGESSKPDGGYDKKTMAVDIHELVKSLGYKEINLVGHDIGLMVAYAYAAQFPAEVKKLALLEAPIPGIGDAWPAIFNDGRLWHFHFVDSKFSLPLVKGRERIFLDHFWEEMTSNPKAMSESERQFYTKAYAQEGSMRAAFEMFKAFDREDAADNRKFAATKLPMPVLTVAGANSMGDVLETQAKMIATDVVSVKYPDTGHWLTEERPAELKAELRKFFVQ